MVNLDLYLSQYLFQLGRDLPDFVAPGLAVALIWFLLAFVLYRAGRHGTKRAKIIFLVQAVSAAVIGLGINAVIAYFYFRVRPFAALDFAPLIDKSVLEKSFPSDHAVVAWALAAVLFLDDKKSGYWGIAAAGLIGLGRVLAGVHYVSDVAVGAGVGVLVGLAMVKISGNAAGRIRAGRRGAAK